MLYIGLDIGGTKCATTLGDLSGNTPKILEKEKFPTAGKTPNEVLELFSKFIEKHIDKKIGGIGISCGGPLDSKRGIIQKPPSLQLWDNIEIVKYFKDKYNIPTYLQNDANACAVAEWKFGAGKGSNNVIFLTFGTGFGAGLILNGKLYAGQNDNAGEIGHVRLTKTGPFGYYKNGSCEGYCSGGGIERLSKIMAKTTKYKQDYQAYIKAVGQDISAKTLAEQARLGNKFCLSVYKKSGEMFGRTLSILIDVINPEKIIVGGVYMRSNDLLLPYAIKVMKKECLSFSLDVCKILPAGLGESIGDFAALSIAKGDF